MSDPAWTDALRDQIFQRVGTIAGYWWTLDRLEGNLHPMNTTKVISYITAGDENNVLITELLLTRVVIRTDGGSEGQIWATIIDGTGGTGHEVKFYSDSSRSTEIATTGATVDDDATGTITAGTGFTLAGTITIGTIVANVDFKIYAVPPAFSRVDDEFDGTLEEDSQMEQTIKDSLTALRNDLRRAKGRLAAAAQQLLTTTISRNLVSGSNTAVIDRGLSRNSAGGIVVAPSGILEDFRLGMADNTGGSGVIKVGPQTATGTNAFPGTWTGTVGTVTLDDRAIASNLQLTCIKTLDSTPPRFRVVSTPTDARRKGGANFSILPEAEQNLTIGQTWRSQKFGVASFILDYLAAPTNSVNTPLTTTATDWAVSSLTTSNSTNGKLFAHFDGTDLNFYATEAGRDSQDTDDVEATVASAAINTAFTVSGSTLTITGKTGAALASGDKGAVDFQVPTATQPASYATIAIAVTVEPGILQALTRVGFFSSNWFLHSASSPNILDVLITSGQLVGAPSFGDTPGESHTPE